MLSILIPVYNNDITKLVSKLHQQAINLNIDFEIIICDDASTNETVLKKNESIKKLSQTTVLYNSKNFGRSFTRNFLAQNASYSWLLFLDSNTGLNQADFLENYLRYFTANNYVIFGGINYNPIQDSSKSLRYLYGTTREIKPIHIRQQQPHFNFTTKNFCIRKEIFTSKKFNEDIKSYGYEDTLFAIELLKLNIPILHIENPITHSVVDTNLEFAIKTQSSLKNLLKFREELEPGSIKILKLFSVLESIKLHQTIAFLTSKNYHAILKWTTKPNAKLWRFDVYRICMLCLFSTQMKCQ